MKVIDENGNIYSSLWIAGKELGFSSGGSASARMKKNGECFIHGHKFEPYFDEEESPTVIVKKDPLVEQLRRQYSDDELRALARGEGIERRRISFPEIRLFGKHHHFVVMSDTHIGSVYSPDEWHNIVSDYVNQQKDLDAVLHCGDLVEGLKISRAGTQIYELSEVGFEAQKNKAVELLSKYKCPVYIIAGNHDMYYKDFAGANIVHAVADALPNVHHIGDDEADIEVDGAVIRLFHGGDGSSYALSYRLQKLAEAITGGHKPNILLAGHVHKFCYIFERNIHAISVPCLQMQTSYMRGKKLAAHTGFLDLQFDVVDGKISNLSVKLFPFYA